MEKLDHIFPWTNTSRTLKKSAELLQRELHTVIEEFAIFNNEASDHYPAGEWEIDAGEYFEFRSNVIGYITGYNLLMGYAIENLIKCISIQRYKLQHPGKADYTFFTVEKEIWKATTHSIRAIAGGCAFSLSDNEKKIVKSLEHYITWAGKYPFPKSSSAYEKAINGHELKQEVTDEMIVDGLYARMLDELEG